MLADYVIVGSGPAGCAFAASVVSRDPTASIIIVERGDALDASETRCAAFPSRVGVARSFRDAIARPFQTRVPSGTIAAVGGSSALNAGAFVDDPEYWASDWNDGGPADERWNPSAMRAAIKRVAALLGVRDEPAVLASPFVDACEGFRAQRVVREAIPGVAGPLRAVFDGDVRAYAARLVPETARLLTGAEARRIVFRGDRTAVDIETKDGTLLVEARKRVVVAAGAEASSRLLLRSGLETPGLGERYCDHPTIVLPFVVFRPPTYGEPAFSAVAFDEDGAQFSYCGHQMLVGMVCLLGRSRLPFRFAFSAIAWLLSCLWRDGEEPFRVGALLATVSRPTTAGVLRLNGDALVSDAPPLDDHDRETLHRARRQAQAILRRLHPSRLNTLLGAVVGRILGTLWHPAGGVPRGIALEPSNLRLRGTSNVHVIGVAAMPRLPRGFPMASCYAMGWRLGEILQEEEEEELKGSPPGSTDFPPG